MPRRSIDRKLLSTQLVALLRREGPLPARALQDHLDASHATISRLLAELHKDVIGVGKGRATMYAARRVVPGLASVIAILEVLPDGSTRQLADLLTVYPHGYLLVWQDGRLPNQYFRDLPYFLDDLRPTGYLGRMIPRRHPALALPDDIRNWSADASLRYLSCYGWNESGSLILGNDAFQLFLKQREQPFELNPSIDRLELYPHLAENSLTSAIPGSSAAGEQPKFLAKRPGDGRDVMVKFSPVMQDAVGRRVADLLICEHLALATIQAFGHAAAKAGLVETPKQIFLELERFDRTPQGGRIGLLSLHSLDAEYIGGLGSWSASVKALAKLKIVKPSLIPQVRWLELFSQLIANTDMHFGNLSFFAQGVNIFDLAPAYDISPMLYAPVGNHLIDREFVPPLPSIEDAALWPSAWQAAQEFWQKAAAHQRISADFRKIAAANATRVASMAKFAALLPHR